MDVHSREALGCHSPAPLLRAALGSPVLVWVLGGGFNIQSTLKMCNNHQCQGNAANSPAVSSEGFGQKQSHAEGTAALQGGGTSLAVPQGSLLRSRLGNGDRGSGSSPSWPLSDRWVTRYYRLEIQSDTQSLACTCGHKILVLVRCHVIKIFAARWLSVSPCGDASLDFESCNCAWLQNPYPSK